MLMQSQSYGVAFQQTSHGRSGIEESMDSHTHVRNRRFSAVSSITHVMMITINQQNHARTPIDWSRCVNGWRACC